MNKKIVISATDNTIRKLKVLAKKKESVRGKLVVTAEKLATTAKKKESVRSKLAVTAEGKEDIRRKLAVTAKELRLKAKNLATTAEEKEDIRGKLVVTDKQLAVTAEEKEDIRRKLEVTAEEKESVRNKLVVTAKQLAVTAEEKEDIRRKLAVTAKELKLKAKNLAVTAEELKLKAKNLAVTAEEKEDIRGKLVVTAEEKEDIRRKLEVTAEELKLKAKNLAVTAEEKEDIRRKLVVTAKQLAQVAKEKEDVRKKLVVTAEQLALTAKKIDLANKYARSLIEASLDPLVTISPEGKITDVNEATIKVTGVPRKQLIGTDFSNYFTKPEKAREGYKTVLKEGSVTDYPLTIKAKDGKLIDVLYNATVYKDVKGNVLGVFAAARDITEQNVIERSRDEFFSIASHELRTPLTAIKGNISLILEHYEKELKNPDLKEMLNDIHESADRLIAIVNDFLNTSRLEQGKMIFKNASLDIVSLVDESIREFDVTGSQKKLYLKFDKPKEKIPLVFADQDKVKQVVINLMGNSIKFTKEGGIAISLAQEGGFIKVLVSDTGMGISDENKKLLFRKFQQAESNIYTRDSTKGTGLGLYISKLIVEGMGGTIKLEKSEANKGTTFSFTLPIANGKEKPVQVPTGNGSSQATNGSIDVKSTPVAEPIINSN